MLRSSNERQYCGICVIIQGYFFYMFISGRGRNLSERKVLLQFLLYCVLCVLQDVGETYYIGGGLFLLVFIAIGAFVFANLVVAVVVTNLVSDKL